MLNCNGTTVVAANDCTRLEVLNISNKNARGEIVLNDEHLLELIQRYPYLYNQAVRPQKDPDYDEWAWESIATSFNRSYADMQQPSGASAPPRHFTVAELQKRWQILTPIIQSLSKAYDLNSIPDSLRQIVILMSAALENRGYARVPHLSETQKVVLDNISWIEHLPRADRRRLEAEVMEQLLAAELNSRGYQKLDEAGEQRVNQEYEDFLKAIRLKELFVLSSDDAAAIEAAAVVEAPTQAHVSPFVCDLDTAESNSTSTLSPDDGEDIEVVDATEEPLLEPLPMPRLHYHDVRPCLVRVRRLNLEDLPLSQIARIKREPKEAASRPRRRRSIRFYGEDF